MKSILSRVRRRTVDMLADCHGIAATEFAVIVPLMLVMYFGTVEFSSGIAVDAKVTLMARTLSDITSRSTSVSDSDMTNFFAASAAIMSPYASAPTQATVTELYVDPATLAARVQWSKGSAPRPVSSLVTIPPQLAVGDTYVIFSEVSYRYLPTIGYVMASSGVNLSDVSYTRPRQSICVIYIPATTPCPKL